MSKPFIDIVLNFVKEAGKISLKYFLNSKPQLKKDQSVITQADQAVSALAKKYLKPLLNSRQHVLIDEESPETNNLLLKSNLVSCPYIWAIDPIDGTRLYANQMPLFGISIGLLKNLKPYLGAVYFPVLGELFYCDGKNAYFVSKAFTKNQQRRVIKPIHQNVSSHSILLCDDAILKTHNWDYKDCQLMIPTCAVVDLCWPIISRGVGSVFKSYLWDFAGSWPIFLKAGLNLRSFSTGKVLDKLDLKAFDQEQKPWKLKEFYILSSAKNYLTIKKKFLKR